jgi:WD40 repeat protein
VQDHHRRDRVGNGAWLVTGDSDGNVQIWDAIRGKRLIGVRHSQDVRGVAFSPDKRRLATGSRERTARIWDVHTGDLKAVLAHDFGVQAVAFSPDGRLLATASIPALIWDAQTGRQLHTLPLTPLTAATETALCHDVSFSPDGEFLAAGFTDRTARVWNIDAGTEPLSLTHDHEVRAVAFSPNGQLLATGDGQSKYIDGTGIGAVRVWRLRRT